MCHPGRVAFSIDIFNGILLADHAAWQLPSSTAIIEIASRVIDMGIGNLIVIDLAGVGRATGSSHTSHIQLIRKTWPHVQIITGGGVRNRQDVIEYGRCGVDAVLVASAIHRNECMTVA